MRSSDQLSSSQRQPHHTHHPHASAQAERETGYQSTLAFVHMLSSPDLSQPNRTQNPQAHSTTPRTTYSPRSRKQTTPAPIENYYFNLHEPCLHNMPLTPRHTSTGEQESNYARTYAWASVRLLMSSLLAACGIFFPWWSLSPRLMRLPVGEHGEHPSFAYILTPCQISVAKRWFIDRCR
ncbi:hypothetical protein M501DRAFT_996563 [Patellaria atrata CBS 101060]|uniref:Uncharacterized protein n=1 Tax=Patellaria atrata CBS 101060 TaxID=1346257 RepID=A0A9P4VKY2_9PEZI|nr:hypothetical protein M501DRAFT_996563 [Patellaria atrata CBS 101060]